MTHNCFVQQYTLPPPIPKEGFRRIWVNEPSPHWEYRKFRNDILFLPSNSLDIDDEIHWHLENPYEGEVFLNLRTLISDKIWNWFGVEWEENNPLEWNNEYETWTPLSLLENGRNINSLYIQYITDIQEKNIIVQLQKRLQDYRNYLFKQS